MSNKLIEPKDQELKQLWFLMVLMVLDAGLTIVSRVSCLQLMFIINFFRVT